MASQFRSASTHRRPATPLAVSSSRSVLAFISTSVSASTSPAGKVRPAPDASRISETASTSEAINGLCIAMASKGFSGEI